MRARLIGLAIVLLGLPAGAALAQDSSRPPGVAGRPLSSVLRTLQARGLKIVFSSEVVRPSMLVESEPRASNDRQVLDEILLPHGLEVRAAPRGVLLVVRRPVRREDQRKRAPAIIRGLVVDAQSATPLPGVLVRLQGGGPEAISDEDGRFEFSGVAAGSHRLYVSAVGYSLAEPEVTVTAGGPLDLTVALAGGTGTYTEEVHVVGDPFRGAVMAVPAAATLTSADLRELRGVLTDDPFRAVQAMPSVMAGNDLRSEFSIRGSDFRHVGLTIDGMTVGWPVHSVRGDLGGGSVGLINADVIESITIAAGAYPQEQPARTGGWMELTLREGSRSRTQAHASVSMTAASLVTEGPLGSSGRGSWLVSARQSFLQWILTRSDADGTEFGYSDVLGKLVFDLTPRQQVQFTAIAGRSLLDLRRVNPDPNLVTRGSASSGLYSAAWRTTFSPRATLVQRIGYATDGFTNDGAFTPKLGDGTGRALVSSRRHCGRGADVQIRGAGAAAVGGSDVHEVHRIRRPAALAPGRTDRWPSVGGDRLRAGVGNDRVDTHGRRGRTGDGIRRRAAVALGGLRLACWRLDGARCWRDLPPAARPRPGRQLVHHDTASSRVVAPPRRVDRAPMARRHAGAGRRLSPRGARPSSTRGR